MKTHHSTLQHDHLTFSICLFPVGLALRLATSVLLTTEQILLTIDLPWPQMTIPCKFLSQSLIRSQRKQRPPWKTYCSPVPVGCGRRGRYRCFRSYRLRYFDLVCNWVLSLRSKYSAHSFPSASDLKALITIYNPRNTLYHQLTISFSLLYQSLPYNSLTSLAQPDPTLSPNNLTFLLVQPLIIHLHKCLTSANRVQTQYHTSTTLHPIHTVNTIGASVTIPTLASKAATLRNAILSSPTKS